VLPQQVPAPRTALPTARKASLHTTRPASFLPFLTHASLRILTPSRLSTPHRPDLPRSRRSRMTTLSSRHTAHSFRRGGPRGSVSSCRGWRWSRPSAAVCTHVSGGAEPGVPLAWWPATVWWVRTVGVDLAAEPAKTAVDRLVDGGGRRCCPRAAEQLLVAAITSADKAGIDCLFGWPEDFVAAHQAGTWSSRKRSPVSTGGVRSPAAAAVGRREALTCGRPPGNAWPGPRA